MILENTEKEVKEVGFPKAIQITELIEDFIEKQKIVVTDNATAAILEEVGEVEFTKENDLTAAIMKEVVIEAGFLKRDLSLDLPAEILQEQLWGEGLKENDLTAAILKEVVIEAGFLKRDLSLDLPAEILEEQLWEEGIIKENDLTATIL